MNVHPFLLAAIKVTKLKKKSITATFYRKLHQIPKYIHLFIDISNDLSLILCSY